MAARPEPEVVIERARQIADDLLFPIAQHVDQASRVPQRSLDVLAEAGLFGMVGPESAGGLDLDRHASWRVVSTIAGGCGSTFFVWAQHHTVVRVVRASHNEQIVSSLLDDLCAGNTIAGVAFAHLRRPGPPAVRATRVDGGWTLDGRSPWTTSWGVADWFAVAGESDDGDLVWALLPGDRPDGVIAAPLSLPVLMSTGTVALRFDRCFVPDERVAGIERADDWRSRDRYVSAIGNPATLGLAGRATRLLAAAGNDDRDAAEAAERLTARHAERCVVFDELLDTIERTDAFARRAGDHRAACVHLAQQAATALLAAAGGRGMDLGHPAQRLAREASFFVIQAQTGDGRAALLRSS